MWTRNIVILDLGIRICSSIHSWYHPIFCINSYLESEENRKNYDLYGYNCFESDIIGKNYAVKRDFKINDRIMIGSVGGYDIPSCKSWIRPFPPIFFSKNNKLYKHKNNCIYSIY